MKFLVLETKEEVAVKAADIVSEVIKNNPKAVLGLATGSSPLGLYAELVKRYKAGELDFSGITSVNLDEYVGLSEDHDQSYRYFMNTNLLDLVNINKENTHVPHGNTDNPEEEARKYNELLESLPPQDIQVLGIGINGHIGFNEPSDNLVVPTHAENLTENTINANARFFEKVQDVPTKAITMGVGNIMRAKKIILIATGENKREAMRRLRDEYVSANNPSSVLKLHDDTIILMDRAAYGE
ncbi:MAG: glucosamine-6-phosphate deaminase [Clostridiaceae bacterium]